ncbi:unnamed protein product [Euphydryas editha]|uniref:C2H2-type domain-containing protein n=1 Tax=Euphydryas editha TaxID=104508 RepID=A0AAU9UPW2_EUPED|nr:unnamed protein product [Euphydryas editha]
MIGSMRSRLGSRFTVLLVIWSGIERSVFIRLIVYGCPILGCVLESEFDVRILDEGVLKIFRLSQLTIEYQQFCRNYLDRSIYVLREEVTNLLKDIESTRRNLREKEEEIRKLKRKSKNFIRAPLTYGNENLATMLLKTLNNTNGDIFNSTSHTDVIQYNKCSYCEKVFLNQLYLKSHISRRHPEVQEMPQKDITDNKTSNENTNFKLNEEIGELKIRLKQMEEILTNTRSIDEDKVKNVLKDSIIIQNNETSCNKNMSKEMKDAEVLTDPDEKILEKIENWKKEEYEKYNQEINLLRKQIIDIISNKEKQPQSSTQNDLNMIEQLHATIKQQNSEIVELKKELVDRENNEKEKRKDIENQMAYWIKQAEKQSNEYKVLLHKLDEVTNVAHEYRARADAEKEKSSKLQDILDKYLNNSPPKETERLNLNKNLETHETDGTSRNVETAKIIQKTATADLITLSKLQQKAQELLNINEISTSESSNTSDDKIKTKKSTKHESDKIKNNNTQKQTLQKTHTNLKSFSKIDKLNKNKKHKNKTNSEKHMQTKKENGYIHIPNSPLKVVRAKITEEVNQRLISFGVDPLRNRLPQTTFQKQRMLLQKEQEIKAKKFPVREKILHSIMAHLDETTIHKNVFQSNDYISPHKSPKTFSLSSVLSNVKTKALSFVKSSEHVNNTNESYNNIAKRAIALLKTPPDSATSSPIKKIQQQNAFLSTKRTVTKSKNNVKNQPSKSLSQAKKIDSFQANDTTDDTASKASDQDDINEQISKIVKSPIRHPVKSPIRHPTDLPIKHNIPERSISANRDDKSSTKVEDLHEIKTEVIQVNKKPLLENKENSSDDVESIDSSPRIFFSEENINNLKQTKGVLKNASSTSSLNKKKVLFDMDAIQMKSVSASPSQSITEKIDSNDNIQFGLNLDTEEWDISSIENEQPKSAVKVQITSHTSSKIAELKQSIESQLTRRNPALSTALVGGVDVLTAPIQKATSFGGSNTSLGSSILDDTDSVQMQNKTLIKSRHVEKDDSEIEISDLINDAVIDNKNYVKSY